MTGRKAQRRRRRNRALKRLRATQLAAWRASPEYMNRLIDFARRNPLRIRPNYMDIGRRMFEVQQLPPGAMPIYSRDL